MVQVILILAALAVVFAIAAAVVGREARRLDAVAPRPLFDLDEAVEWVANHLPFEVGAELSHAHVRRILDLNLEYFRSKGVSANGSQPHLDTRIVVGGAETVAYVLERSQAAGENFSASHVHAVLEAQMTYLEAIGAIGPEAGAEDDPPK
ncbi:MAG: hypothetical protein ACRD0D_02895 [Acidimicrobiales bacterium]